MANSVDMQERQSEPEKPRESTSPQAQRVLIVVSDPDRAQRLESWLGQHGYRTRRTEDAARAEAIMLAENPDLAILDANLASEAWINVCRALRGDEIKAVPVLLMLSDTETVNWDQVVEELEIGQSDSINDFLVWPCSRDLLVAKVRTTLRISTLQYELRISNSMLKELTEYLNNMVETKVAELENVNRLRRFFSPQIVEAIVSKDSEEMLKEHRSEITVVFLDLREFTPFAETHSPQEVFQLVREFHETVGPAIFRHGGTLERFTGDGLMVFLGDPNPIPDHAYEAIRMALHIQYMIGAKRRDWTQAGYGLGLGIGVATGEATLGAIGFERRYDYAAIGAVTNLAARLCSRAESGQILIAEETHEKIQGRVKATNCGRIHLKGFSNPSVVYQVDGLTQAEPTPMGD